MLKSLRPLAPYFVKYKWSYVLGALSVLLQNGIWVLFPQVIQRAVDSLTQAATLDKLRYYALLLIAVAFSKGIFQFLNR